MAEVTAEIFSITDGGGGALNLSLAELELNDIGNAERFLARHRADVRYVRDIGWHVWTGRHWQHEGAEDLVRQRAHETARDIRSEADACQKASNAARRRREALDQCSDAHSEAADEVRRFDGLKSALWAWSLDSGEGWHISAMLKESRPYVGLGPEELDADSFAINLENGTLALAGACEDLRPHRREDLLAKICPVRFEPEAEAPRFMRFLHEVHPDQEVRTFLQRYIGYCMTGSTSAQVLVFNWGEGANGKSTFVAIVARILGPYAVSLPFTSLVRDDRRRGGDATPDLARLPGARLVRASEPERGARFGEATIKALTGEEEVTARHLHHGFFDFEPTHKLMISGNHKPIIRGTDYAIWRRLILVPWTVRFRKEDRDPDLGAKLWAERSGILNWMLDGCRRWLEWGLEVPEKIEAATEAFKQESDPVGRFITECIGERRGHEIPAREVYLAYCKWARANAEVAFKEKGFASAMEEHRMTKSRGRVRMYQNIDIFGVPDDQAGPNDPPPAHSEGDYLE